MVIYKEFFCKGNVFLLKYKLFACFFVFLQVYTIFFELVKQVFVAFFVIL